MKRLPVWMLLVMVVLSLLMIWAGWHDRDEAGILPFLMGLVWAAFTVVSVTRVAAPETARH
jgi:hypothetical protein